MQLFFLTSHADKRFTLKNSLSIKICSCKTLRKVVSHVLLLQMAGMICAHKIELSYEKILRNQLEGKGIVYQEYITLHLGSLLI